MLSREYAKEKYSEILGVPIEHAIVQNLEKHTSNWAYIERKNAEIHLRLIIVITFNGINKNF